MASLLWTVLLPSLVCAQVSDVVDEAQLADLVSKLLHDYQPTYQVNGNKTPTFTLAVSIPFDTTTRRFDWSQVTAADSAENVTQQLNNCEVYEGDRVVGAMVLKWPSVKTQCPDAVIPEHWSFVRNLCPEVQTWRDLGQQCTNSINKKLTKSPNGAVDHAEYRVLQNFNNFVNRLNNGQLNRNDLMLFYSYKSPCDSRCGSLTNSFSIVESIKDINRWPKHVLVFSKVFVPISTSLRTETLQENRRTALQNLGNAINGVRNVYRCPVGLNRCTRCGEGESGSIADACVRDDTGSRSNSPYGK